MIFSNRKNLHDHIVQWLLEHSGTVADIMQYLDTQNISPTVQGVYKSLRELMTDDIVVKQKQTYSISNVWRNKVVKLVSGRSAFSLSAGEEVIYRFQKLEHLDMFWKHSMQDIQDTYRDFPIFHALPHNFWYYVPGRKESEEEYYSDFEHRETHAYSIIGGKTIHDTLIKQNYTHPFHQYELYAEYPFSRRDHLSIIGPYIITTRVSSTLTRVVDHVYNIAKTEKELSELLRNKFAKPGATIMTVEHNETKAKKLRKRMAKDFYVPRELRERFELF